MLPVDVADIDRLLRAVINVVAIAVPAGDGSYGDYGSYGKANLVAGTPKAGLVHD
jgi:hypothetical protein